MTRISGQPDFWLARPELGHIRDFAKARLVAPWAMLGIVLSRIVAATPPDVVLPPTIGGQASLNLFVGLVAPSGIGKGTATRAAADAVQIVGGVNTVPVGSGEGLAHLFMRRDKEGGIEQHTQSVLLDAPEIDTLTALGSRNGATLMSELRKAWSGEDLGFGYADPKKRLPVPAHRYRLSMVVGIQPNRAGGLLADADGGTPQRFLWMPALDPDMEDGHEAPEPIKWTMPRRARTFDNVEMKVCKEALKEIKEAHIARHREGVAGLDGHASLTRLKTAAALALLDGRIGVSSEDWSLAKQVMDESDKTRAAVVEELQRDVEAKNVARGKLEGVRAHVASETAADIKTKRVAARIVDLLEKAEGRMAGNLLRKKIAHRDREYIEPAVELLRTKKRISQRPAASGDGYIYHLRGSG